MRIFHLISEYLPASQIWLYHQLHYNQVAEHHIGTQRLLPHNFFDPDFRFCISDRGPLRSIISKLDRSNWRDRSRHARLFAASKLLLNEREQWGPYVRQQRIDLVHVHFADIAYRYRHFLEALEIPFIVSFYGHDYERAARRTSDRKARIQHILRKASAITAEGPFGATQLREKWQLNGRIEVLPLGIPLPDAPEPKDGPHQPLRLLQIANITEKKGQLSTVQATHALLQRGVPTELTLVGNVHQPAYFKGLLDYLRTHRLSERVSIRPFLPYSQLDAFLRQFDVFVHPSQWAADGDCEGGAPIVLLDVQARGLPVVATNHCDIPAEVAHGKSGILVAEGDMDGLTDAIQSFAQMDQATYLAYSRAAREWVAERFDVQYTAARCQQLYHSIV